MTPIAEAPYDVIVVGSGVSGALIAWKLAAAGARVLILEAGPKFDRSTGVANAFGSSIPELPESPYPVNEWAPAPSSLDPQDYYVQVGPDLFSSNYERLVGGTTWHWLGTAIRLIPTDFSMQSTFGVGVDWPISYDDLDPWYQRAEEALGVAGDDSADDGAPRSTRFPMPPIATTWGDRQVAKAVESLGLSVIPTPQARVSIEEGYNGRPQCCGNAFCIPMCPIGAKYDATVHVDMAVQAGAELIDSAVVHTLSTSADGQITGITYRRPDGSDVNIPAGMIVLAAHAIETPKILLNSRNGQFPKGLANSSDQVGRNLMDHPTQLSYALAANPMGPYRSPQSTSGIEQLRDGAFREKRSSYRIEIGNDGWSWPGLDPVGLAQQLIGEGVWGTELYNEISRVNLRAVRLAALCEQLPDPESRVALAEEVDAIGLPRPQLNYIVDDYARAGLAEAQKTFDGIFAALDSTEITHVDGFQGAGHIMGTYRMGADAADSVARDTGQTWDHPNLWLAGAGLFPTTGTGNPTLTIAALALRTADAMLGELQVATPIAA